METFIGIIRSQLAELNNIPEGDAIFQKIGILCCRKEFPDVVVFESSGSDAGGDGGYDAYFEDANRQLCKVACTIQKKYKVKIKAEIEKSPWAKILYYYTNQVISGAIRERLSTEYPGIKIYIRDRNDLLKFIESDKEMLEYLKLPSCQKKLSFEYLKDHDQLVDEAPIICTYIPRKILRKDTNSKDSTEYCEQTFTDYCLTSKKLTFLEAPAGYGKTCAIKQLRYAIINLGLEDLLLPIYIPLRNYVAGNLQHMITDRLSISGDYFFDDYLLLLDGFDELNQLQQRTLLCDLEEILNANQSYQRKAIITARTNEYSKELIPNTIETEFIYLKGISHDDIKGLMNSSDIVNDNYEILYTQLINEYQSDNIYYIVGYLDYYHRNQKIPTDMIDLLEYLTKKEGQLLYRGQPIDWNQLESIALCMTYNQSSYVDNLNEIHVKFPFKSLEFSHKNIQEYLAAKKLAQLSIEKTLSFTMKLGLIIPHMKNTVGLLLNILSRRDDTYNQFCEIYDAYFQDSHNIEIFLKIDSGYLTPEQRSMSLKKAIDSYAINNYSFGASKQEFFNLFFDKNEIEPNTDYLCKKISDAGDSFTQSGMLSLLHILSLSNQEKFPLKFKISVISLFVASFQNQNKSNYADFSTLAYSVCLFPEVNILSDDEIRVMITTVSRYWKDQLFNNICRILIKRNKLITQKQYQTLFNVFCAICENANKNTAHIIPPEVSDDEYFESMEFDYIDDFFVFSKKILSTNTKLIWSVLSWVRESNFLSNDFRKCDEINKYFEVLADYLAEISLNRVFLPKEMRLILMVVYKEFQTYCNSVFFKYLSEKCEIFNMIQFMKYALSTNRDRKMKDVQPVFVDFIVHKILCDVGNREMFQSVFESLPRVYNELLLDATSYSSFPLVIEPELSTEVQFALSTRQKEQQERKDNEKGYEQLIKISFHVAFDKSKLINEIRSIFDMFDDKTITSNTNLRYDKKHFHRLVNQFGIYLLMHFIKLSNPLTLDDTLIQLESWEQKKFVYLIGYMEYFHIPYSELTCKETKLLREWVCHGIEKYPIPNFDSEILTFHHYLSLLMHSIDLYPLLKTCIAGKEGKLTRLMYYGDSHFYQTGSASLSYDSFSLDYLEPYFGKDRMIEFLLRSFPKLLEKCITNPSNHALISFSGYLIKQESLKPYQKKELLSLRNDVQNFLEANFLSEDIPNDVYKLAKSLNVQAIDFSQDQFQRSLILDSPKKTFIHNIAYHYLDIYTEKNAEEKSWILQVLDNIYKTVDDDYIKKVYAEYILYYDNERADVFHWYTNYLTKVQGSTLCTGLLSPWHKPGIMVTNKNAIEDLEKLYAYSLEGKISEKRSKIQNLVLQSYKAIANRYNNNDDTISLIEKSLLHLADKYNAKYLGIEAYQIKSNYIDRVSFNVNYQEFFN